MDEETNAQQSSAAEPKKKSVLQYVIIGLLALGAILLIGNSYKKANPKVTAISGTIDFNGLSPADAKDPSTGKIVLLERLQGETSYRETGTEIAFEDNASWVWAGAKEGETYNLKADVYFKGQLIESSTVIAATAPAVGEVLTFNITIEDLPASITETSQAASTISGVIKLNGYVPSGSYVTIYQRKTGEENFSRAVPRVAAVTGTNWSWEGATSGEEYEMQAELYNSSGTFIGQSDYLIITAPARNEVFEINSSAEAPSQEASISGIIHINGPVQQGSTLLLLQRVSGMEEYQDFGRVEAKDGQTFTFEDAIAGKTYDITAALQVSGNNTATANSVTVSAPAEDVELAIDTKLNLPAPTGMPSVSCGAMDATGKFNATVSYPVVTNAQAYYGEVGTQPGYKDVLGKGVEAKPGVAASFPIYISGETNYYARYAYTLCLDCNYYDVQNWSSYSPTLGFRCAAAGVQPAK